MELFIWGMVALSGYFIVSAVRSKLERKRLEREHDAFMERILLARIQIHKEKHGVSPTAKEILKWHDEVRGL